MNPNIGYAESATEAPIKNLPVDAKEIRYYMRGLFGPITAYEFLTTEENFKKWVLFQKDLRNRDGEIKDGQSHPLRYNQETNEFERIQIVDGLLFSSWIEDRGLVMSYDRSTGVAYFQVTTR